VQLLQSDGTLLDTGGREVDPGQVIELRALARYLSGDPAGAVRDLVLAMAGYGRINGVAELARTWAEPRTLVAAVQAHGGPHAGRAVQALIA
jgi:hypothetical protein